MNSNCMPVKVKEMHDPAQAYVYGFLKNKFSTYNCFKILNRIYIIAFIIANLQHILATIDDFGLKLQF